MQYAKARNCKLPIGSGPMESAIRRVINLRMKGNGIFWLEKNAEAMIMLRSFYKADAGMTCSDWQPIPLADKGEQIMSQMGMHPSSATFEIIIHLISPTPRSLLLRHVPMSIRCRDCILSFVPRSGSVLTKFR